MKKKYFTSILGVFLLFSSQASSADYTYKLLALMIQIYEGHGTLYIFRGAPQQSDPAPFFNCQMSDDHGWFAMAELHVPGPSTALDYYGVALKAISRNAEVKFELGECLPIPDLGISVMLVEGISIVDEG